MTAELVAVVLVTGFAAATQSITGFGYALIVVPGLTLLFGPKAAVVAMTSVGVPLVAWNAMRWRADIQRREAITVRAFEPCRVEAAARRQHADDAGHRARDAVQREPPEE